MTSSCGGTGAKTPLEWVRRKQQPGWQHIVKELEKAEQHQAQA
jgi:hypothetical protein